MYAFLDHVHVTPLIYMYIWHINFHDNDCEKNHFIIYIMYNVIYNVGLIQSSATNKHLPCHLQQISHDSESLSPQYQH